ncbi:MAG: CGNR zinc finger domain-containing protein [Bacteroidetes bacterium]|nr:CGNR zinc finger domain-containing protein [Bacteroidota bacterium]
MSENEKWKFIGGNLCLDFINTVGGRVENDADSSTSYTILSEKLNDFLDLADWGKKKKLLNEKEVKELILFSSENNKAANRLFQRAITFREAIYRIFKGISEGREPTDKDINIINTECLSARENQTLIYENKLFAWKFVHGGNEAENIIRMISLSAAELLTSEQIKRIKQCPGENCGWLFLDTSKNGSRQWCDMKVCGNLAKVRRFRVKNK